MWSPQHESVISTGDLQFVGDGRILFIASTDSLSIPPSHLFQENFTECEFVVSVEDNIVEDGKTALVMIDLTSLMPNDVTGDSSLLNISVMDNDGMVIAICKTYLHISFIEAFKLVDVHILVKK